VQACERGQRPGAAAGAAAGGRAGGARRAAVAGGRRARSGAAAAARRSAGAGRLDARLVAPGRRNAAALLRLRGLAWGWGVLVPMFQQWREKRVSCGAVLSAKSSVSQACGLPTTCWAGGRSGMQQESAALCSPVEQVSAAGGKRCRVVSSQCFAPGLMVPQGVLVYVSCKTCAQPGHCNDS